VKKIHVQILKKILNVNSLKEVNNNFLKFLNKKISILEKFDCKMDITQYIVIVIMTWQNNFGESLI
jgi:hypothetical protein